MRNQGTMASQERIDIISKHLARFHQKVWDPKEQAFELFQAAAALEAELFQHCEAHENERGLISEAGNQAQALCHCGKDGHALSSVNCPVHGYEIVPKRVP